jgi:LysR family glycine cleavage system transcriptional activator
MRRLPPLNAIRAFEAAARHGNFTRAAAELNVTHGAISRQVALLEQWTGTRLFRRLRRQMMLTPEGQMLLAEVGPALDRIASSVAAMGQAKPITLLLNAPPTFTMRWLIPRLSGFQRRHPSIDIRLSSSIDPIDFSTGSYEIAIRRLSARSPGMFCEGFLPEEALPVCSPALFASGRLKQPQDLADETLIHTLAEPDAWPNWLEWVGCKGLRAKTTLNFEHLYYALQAAVEGLGIPVVPYPLVADDVAAGRLCVPFQTALKARQYSVVHPALPHKKEPMRLFCEWLVEEGASTPRLGSKTLDE